MNQLRKSEERGYADHGWLKSFHTFTFAGYQDPEHVHFRKLRVINEDFVNPGKGFDTHAHADMEIITYVLEGALSHRDSMGNGSTILPGEVQVMSAGTGVTHSEYNHSESARVHLLQIWIFPDKKGYTPSYQQKKFDEARRNQLCLVVSADGREGSLVIHQDACLFASILETGKALSYSLAAGRHAWIQVANGQLSVNDQLLAAGDGLAVSDSSALKIKAKETAEFLLFDLANFAGWAGA